MHAIRDWTLDIISSLYLSAQKKRDISYVNDTLKDYFDYYLNKFKILHKKHNEDNFSKESKFNKTFNYIFIR
jgi:hypothetical protein